MGESTGNPARRWIVPGRQLVCLALALTFPSSVNAPLVAQAAPAGCLTSFVPSPQWRTLVRTLDVPRNELGRTQLFSLEGEQGKDFRGFIEQGGSILLRSDEGAPLEVINRDSLPRLASNQAIGAFDVTSSPDQTITIDLGDGPAPSVSLPRGYPAQDGGDVIFGGSAPRTVIDDLFPTSPTGGLIGGWPFGGDSNPYGVVVGGFFDGSPITTPPANLGNPGTLDPVSLGGAGASLPNRPSVQATRAVVAIYYRPSAGQDPAPCNGVQVAPGKILTNLHCATAATSGHVIHFGQLTLSPDTLLKGTAVSGEVRCPATIVSPRTPPARQDFAILQINGTIPEPYKSAILPLDTTDIQTSLVSGDVPAWQVQYWLRPHSVFGKLYQKYAMEPGACRLRQQATANDARAYCTVSAQEQQQGIDPRGISHMCDSDHGSSGSPLLHRDGKKIIALHRSYGGIFEERNCAIPAATIRSQLVSWGIL
jgi:hypothetical protein